MEKKTERSFLFGFIAVTMIVLVTAMACAGSIEGLDYEDCTDFREDCLQSECSRRFWGFCIEWRCLETQETCTESIPQTIDDSDVDIDADTLEGKDYSDIRKAFKNQDKKNYDSIMENDERWSEDMIGGGIAIGTVEWMLDDYNIYMLEQVIQMQELLEESIMIRLDQIMCRLEYGEDISSFDLSHCTARKIAARTGVVQVLSDGYRCDSKTCIRFRPVIPVIDVPEPDPVIPDWRLEILEQWDELCDRGLTKWCQIADQNRKEWGMD